MGGLNMNNFKGDDYIAAAKKAGADIVSPYFMELSPDKVAQAHELGMKVVPWTVNSVKDMNMLIDMGVDGFITDKPHMARELLIQRGIPVADPSKAPAGMVYSTGTSTVDAQSKELSKGGDAAH
jgi:glycerophosphoryl diester phosphodiesterase